SPTLFWRSTPRPIARHAPFRWESVPSESRSASGRDSKCQARFCWVSPPSRRLADALVVVPQEHPEVQCRCSPGLQRSPTMAKLGSGQSGHAPATTDKRALPISGWLTGVYFVIELGTGLWTGSVAVTSDAFHTFSAVGGVLVALVAGRYAERPATDRASYGLIRAEIVGALFNGLFLLGMAALVLWMGAMRLRDPVEVETGPMLWAAAGGLVTEVIALRLLYARQKGNLNMKG